MEFDPIEMGPEADSQQNTEDDTARSNWTGRPDLVTIHAKAETDVIKAGACEHSLLTREDLETVESIRRGLEELEAGETVRVAVVKEELLRLSGG